MGDPIWVDANVVAAAVNGNKVYEAELRSRVKAGHKLLLTPQANQELLNGNPLTMKGRRPVWEQVPSPQSRIKIQQFLTDLGIEVDLKGGRMPDSVRIREPHPAVSISDDMVLNQVRTGARARGVKNPVFLTGEQRQQGVITQGKSHYGVEVVQLRPTVAPPTARMRIIRVGRVVGGTLVGVAVSLLMAYLRKKIDQALLEKQVKEDMPLIQSAINERIPMIADIQAKGKKAYANVFVHIINTIHCTSSRATGVAVCETSVPAMKLQYVDISADNINGEGVPEALKNGASGTSTPFMFSMEVTATPETVAAWRDFMAEWQWFENEKKKYSGKAFADLNDQQEVLRREIYEAFGEKPANHVLNAWMWPRFKFRPIR